MSGAWPRRRLAARSADRLLSAALLIWALFDVPWWWRPPGHGGSTLAIVGMLGLADGVICHPPQHLVGESGGARRHLRAGGIRQPGDAPDRPAAGGGCSDRRTSHLADCERQPLSGRRLRAAGHGPCSRRGHQLPPRLPHRSGTTIGQCRQKVNIQGTSMKWRSVFKTGESRTDGPRSSRQHLGGLRLIFMLRANRVSKPRSAPPDESAAIAATGYGIATALHQVVGT